MRGPVVLPTAYRHDVAEGDMLHAYRNAVRSYPNQGQHELTLLVGPTRNGMTMLAVGYVEADNGERFIVHGMPARSKYL